MDELTGIEQHQVVAVGSTYRYLYCYHVRYIILTVKETALFGRVKASSDLAYNIPGGTEVSVGGRRPVVKGSSCGLLPLLLNLQVG